MSTPHPVPEHDENLELLVEESLQRATVHPPYGEQVIDDPTPEEADAFLDARMGRRRLGIPLVSNDGICGSTPGLVVETART